MAYSKTTWQNGKTALNDVNLNHIEDGIYANSVALENSVVHNTGDETIEGTKTFTKSIHGPNFIMSSDENRGLLYGPSYFLQYNYNDGQFKEIYYSLPLKEGSTGDYTFATTDTTVNLTGDQTISGNKTFSGNTTTNTITTNYITSNGGGYFEGQSGYVYIGDSDGDSPIYIQPSPALQGATIITSATSDRRAKNLIQLDSVDGKNFRVMNLATPETSTDATNKEYVDNKIATNPIPSYSVNTSNKVITFLQAHLEVLDKMIILKFANASEQGPWICIFNTKNNSTNKYRFSILNSHNTSDDKLYYAKGELSTSSVDTTFDELFNNNKVVVELESNKVTTIDANSTDTQYPSAKCVWDNFVNSTDNQTVAGEKTFSNIKFTGTEPTTSYSGHIGTSSKVYFDGYINNITTTTIKKLDGSVNYGLNVPDTTSWTANKVLATTDDVATKQDTLVSGTNIKTINGQSILGEGNIATTGYLYRHVYQMTDYYHVTQSTSESKTASDLYIVWTSSTPLPCETLGKMIQDIQGKSISAYLVKGDVFGDVNKWSARASIELIDRLTLEGSRPLDHKMFIVFDCSKGPGSLCLSDSSYLHYGLGGWSILPDVITITDTVTPM